MRKLLLSALLVVFFTGISYGQSSTQPTGVDLEYVTWVDGDVLVRFDDHVAISFNKYHETGIGPIDAILQDLEIKEVEQLFPYAINIPDKADGFYTYNGLYVEYPTLHNIYRINFKDSLGANLFDVIEDLAGLTDFVKYAEPNYYSGIMGVTPANEPNDTLYSQQWANEAIQADTVQARMAADPDVSDTNQVIAIIDTGVDKDHEDLKNKMWVNLAELNGSPNVDDDQNGFVDDIYGWDFINNDGNPMDDNSHGTHCAGSAAAEVNNQKGIAGVSPGAKIMGVKVMQSSGYGNSADIAQGIAYAANNGATVISMSIGGAAESQIQKDALAVAYAYSFLVASAGNSNQCIGQPFPLDYKCPITGKNPKRNFPAAFSYVLGVESSRQFSSGPFGNKSGFSNYDEDGPIASGWPQLWNYEVRAPGSQILSAIPAGNTGNNGRYRFQQGTSMACPAVAGGVALLKSFKPTFTHEKVFLHLIKTQTDNIQLNTAIDFILPTEIMYVTNTIVDTLSGGDNDGRADAGETVELVVKLKNTGGYNDSIWGSIELDGLEDPSLVTFIDSVRFFGSVSEYATIENNVPDSLIFPFKFTFNSNVANSRGIKFKLNIWTGDSMFHDTSQFEIVVQNGIEYSSSYYPGVTTFYPNKYYLISGNTLFDTLIIKPGTEVYIEAGKSINGKFITCEGTKDSLIYLRGVRGLDWEGINVLNPWNVRQGNSINEFTGTYHNSKLRYTVIENYYDDIGNLSAFQGFYEISNCIINYSRFYIQPTGASGDLSTNNLNSSTDSSTNWQLASDGYQYSYRYKTLLPSSFSGGGPFRFFSNQFNQCSFLSPSLSAIPSEGDKYLSTNTIRNVTDTVYYYGQYRFIDVYTIPVYPLQELESRKVEGNSFINCYHPYQNRDYSNPPNFDGGFRNQYLADLKANHSNDVFMNWTGGTYWSGPRETPWVKTPHNTSAAILKSGGIYLGGKSEAFLNNYVLDYFEANSHMVLNQANLIANNNIPEKAHGFVVDIKIDGVSTHWVDNPYNTASGTGILGNDTYKFTVQFNRAMDVEVTPFLTFGIREPWTQNIVADSAYWSADSTEFNAYVTIDPLTQSDGINRISVRLAKDNEGFPCPTENVRFECRISSTGSLSAGFAAVGDTGKIHLDWGIPDDAIDDYLGTNMYRIDSTNLSSPTYVYSQMQVDSMMTDTTVQAGKWYGYYYKIVRTSLTELNESDTVWARPWQGKPTVETKGSTNKTHNTITINGKANPNYLATDVRFNYGTSTNYSTNTTWQSIGNGSEFVTKSVNLSGLTPGQTYHYRIEAKNAEGASYGKDSTFTMKDFPTLAYTYDSTLCVGDAFTITNSSTISTGTLSYTWQVRNASGSLVHTSTDVNPTFTMASAGVYTIKLTASSSDAVTTTKTTGLVVEALPTPTITASGPTSLCQGETVTLSGSTGYQTYAWNSGQSTSSITVTSANTYTLTVTTANGCAGTTSSAVVVNALPVSSVSSSTGDYDFCEGSSLLLEAPLGASGYQWYKDGSVLAGATSQSISATSSGSYAVQVTSSDGCSSLSSAQTVTKNALPTASISAGSSLSFCDGGSVTLSAPSGMSYAWTTGSTTQSVTQSSSGQVGLTITDANGCSSTATPVTVNVYSVPTLTVTAASSTSICQGQSVTLQASGGFSSYAWSNGATNQNLIATTAGSYSVTGTTSDGCTASSVAQSVVVNPNPVSTVTNSGNSVLCSGQSTTLSAPSGMSSYLWSDGSTTQSITASTAGNYAVTVTNSNGCSSTSAATSITTSSITTPSITASGSTTLCSGSSVTLSVPTGYASYLWSDGSTTNSISASSAGDYSVTVTNADGCSATTTATSVVVNALPVSSVSSSTGDYDFCEGSSLLLEAPLGASGYQWYKDGSVLAGATSQSISATSSGSYAVQVTSSDGCSSLSSAQTVTKNALPTASISAGSSLSFCDGGSVTLSAPSGMSYAWTTGSTTQSVTQSSSGQVGLTITDANGCSSTATPVTVNVYSVPTLTVTAASSTSICQGQSVTLQASGGFSSYAWSNGATNQNLIATTAGSYSVTGTTSDGCTASSVAQSVVVNPNPVSTVTNSGNSVLCSGQSTTLSAPSGMSSYLWSDGSTTQSITASTAGNYAVTVTNSDGCSSTSAATSITTSSITTPSITASGSTTLCSGSSVTLSVPTGYASYLWSDGSTTNSISASSAGDYSVTVTNADGCSTTTTATSITVNTPPTASITSTGTGAICAGASETLSAPSNMASYQWYVNGTAITGATSSTYTANASGNYSVSVVDANGCSDLSSNYTITNAAAPTATITNTGTTICVGDSTTLTAPAGMSSYLWSDGSTTQSITTSTAGSYSVTVTNTAGCSATSAATAIATSNIATPSITASGSTTLCSGSSVTLSVPTGYASYSWSNGATTNSIAANTSGSYTVTVTNSDGCSATTSATSVTVNTPPTASINSTGTGAICAGGFETLSGPTGMTSYQWYLGGNAISGATSASLTATTAGTYSLSVVDGNGCSATSPLYTITTAANPVATIVNSGSALLCSGASTTLTAPAGMNGYTWSTGDTTQSIVVSSAGSYTVTVVNAGGCSATSAATVISTSQIAAPTISVSGTLAFCAGGSVTLGVPMGYSSYSWNSGAISTQLVATQAGDYYATVTNSDGCTASSDTVSVVVFATPPTPSIGYTANDTIMISSIADGNQWYFNGNILQGETNDTLRPLNFGNYSVRVVDTNGCEGGMSAMQFYNSVGIAEDLERMIKLYPNPTSGMISLELGGLDLEVIRVIDGRGRLVREITSCGDYCQIDISEMRDGMYQLVFITSEGLFVSKSVVLQK